MRTKNVIAQDALKGRTLINRIPISETRIEDDPGFYKFLFAPQVLDELKKQGLKDTILREFEINILHRKLYEEISYGYGKNFNSTETKHLHKKHSNFTVDSLISYLKGFDRDMVGHLPTSHPEGVYEIYRGKGSEKHYIDLSTKADYALGGRGRDYSKNILRCSFLVED